MKKLSERIKILPKVSFVRDTAVMQIGNGFSTFINVLASVAFARILLPEKYGIYSLVFALAGLFALFMNLGADRATLILFAEAYQKKDKKEVLNIFVYFLKISLIVSLGVWGLAIIIAPIVSIYMYGAPYVGELVRIIILANILGIFYEMVSIILQVMRKIKGYVFFDNVKNLLRILFGFAFIFSLGVFGLMVGYLLASAIAMVLAIFIYSHLRKKYDLLPSFREIAANWKKVYIKNYFRFGFLIAINQNVSRLYGILPVLLLSLFYPTETVGYFNIAMKYVSLPLVFLSPVSQLLAVRLPQLKAEKNPLFARNFFKASIMSGAIALLLIIPAIILAPFLVELFYGKEYIESIKVIYWLSPFTILSGLAVGIGPLFRTLNKMKEVIMINSLVIILGLLPGFYLIKNYGLFGMAAITVVWFAASDLLAFIYIRKFIK
ncbi:MAG: oligosaccharide flippase family protein [Parcubacteria group bacterium]|nr:oligosaccharide flippase family protein [Parcubacteria group bacterium]MCR4342528.1 oligosaccharide flippase family protein [Patescibacteria group bacterium]